MQCRQCTRCVQSFEGFGKLLLLLAHETTRYGKYRVSETYWSSFRNSSESTLIFQGVNKRVKPSTSQRFNSVVGAITHLKAKKMLDFAKSQIVEEI